MQPLLSRSRGTNTDKEVFFKGHCRALYRILDNNALSRTNLDFMLPTYRRVLSLVCPEPVRTEEGGSRESFHSFSLFPVEGEGHLQHFVKRNNEANQPSMLHVVAVL